MKARKDCSNLSGRIILDLIHNVRNELWKLISKILIVLIKTVLWWNGIFLIPESSSTNRDFVDNHICLSEICSQRYFLLLLKMFKICHCLKKKENWNSVIYIYIYVSVCIILRLYFYKNIHTYQKDIDCWSYFVICPLVWEMKEGKRQPGGRFKCIVQGLDEIFLLFCHQNKLTAWN